MMSWTDLSLTSDWNTFGTYQNARVRPLTTPASTAELEGYLIYSGSGTANVAITTGALPSGCYDPSHNHTICGRWYNSSGAHVGTCELLIAPSEALTVEAVPSGGYSLWFGDIYPVA